MIVSPRGGQCFNYFMRGLLDHKLHRASNAFTSALKEWLSLGRWEISLSYCALTQVSEPVSLAATFVKVTVTGLPSAVPR